MGTLRNPTPLLACLGLLGTPERGAASLGLVATALLAALGRRRAR